MKIRTGEIADKDKDKKIVSSVKLSKGTRVGTLKLTVNGEEQDSVPIRGLGGGSSTVIGGSVDTQALWDAINKKVDVDFFKNLFTVYDSSDIEIATNTYARKPDNLKISVGTWTEEYLSALGKNSEGGGGGGVGTVIGIALGTGTTPVYPDDDTGIVTLPAYPTKVSQLVNDSGFVTSSTLNNYVTSSYLANNFYTKAQADSKYMTIAAFESLFNALDSNGDKINHPYSSGVDSIKALVGLWTEQYLSALGQNGEGGGGGTGTVTAIEVAPNVYRDPDDDGIIHMIGDVVTSTERIEWNAAAANSHTHSNKAALDTIDASKIANWNNVATIMTPDGTPTISRWPEVVSFLSGYTTSDSLSSLLANKVDVRFFNSIFTVYDDNGNAIVPNTYTQVADNLKLLVGTWTEEYLSALGKNSKGSGGGGAGLEDVWDSLTNQQGTVITDNTKIAIAHIPDTSSTYGYLKASALNGYATQTWVNQQGFLTTHQTLYTLSIYGGTTKVLDFKPNANASIYIKAGGDISLTNDTTNKYITLSYTHPTNGANTTISAASGKVLSAITVNSLGHVTSVSSKTLASADIPDLSSTYATAARATTLEGYFTNGVAKTAAKLNTGTTTYTAWGQTYWSSGVPQSISGNMTSVGSITPSANGNALGTTSARFAIYGTSGNYSSTLTVADAITLSGSTAAKKRIYFGDTSHYLELNSTGFHFSHGVYSDSFVSALGANSSGGGSGTFDEEAMWTALGTTSTAKVIATSHIPNLDTSKITSGTFAAARIPDLSGRYYALYGGTAITGTSSSHYDLNNLLTVGSYYCAGGATAAYIDNKPTNTNSAFRVWVSATTGTASGHYLRQRFQFFSQVAIYERTAINDSDVTSSDWGNWYLVQASLANYALASSLNNYLPLSGGTLTGALTVPKIRINTRHSSGDTRGGIYYYNGTTDYLLIGQGSANLWIGANETSGTHHTGGTYISAGTENVNISRLVNGSRLNYMVLDSGNYSSYALPLTGGTITLSSIDGLTINKSTNAAGMIRFTNGSTLLGYLGYYGAGVPACNIGGNYRALLHTDNFGNFAYALYGGTNLSPSESNVVNLNSITDYGSYYCDMIASASYVENKPTGATAFRLWVSCPLGTSSNYIRQRYQGYAQIQAFERYSNTGGSTWSAWYRCQADVDGEFLPLTGGTLTGSLTVNNYSVTALNYNIKFDVDTSREIGLAWLNTSGTRIASVTYHNTYKNIIINPVGSSNTWSDAVGKYSLFVGNNKLTYNTYTILHSNNTYVSSGTGYINGTAITKISGNAGTATTLATPRTLWGQSFNGSANVSGDMSSVGTITSANYTLATSTTNPYLKLSHTYNSTNYNYYIQGYEGTLRLGPSSYPVKIDSSGNVGIGTTPSYKLHVNGSIATTTANSGTIRLISAGSINYIQSGNAAFNGNADMTIGGYNATTGTNLALNFSTVNATNNLKVKTLLFMNNGAEGIYLTGSGINWHNASDAWTKSIMSFASNGVVTQLGGHFVLAGAQAASSTGNTTQIIFTASGAQQVAISSNPSALIINPTSSTTTKQIVLGVGSVASTFGNSITCSGEVTASSDGRKKNIISNTKFNVKDIASARSVLFEWNDGRDDDMEKKIHGGSIAQDWLGKADSFLSQDNDGWYSINYGALALCSAITIAREVVKHEDEITRLKKEVVKLRERVAELEERRIA